MWHFDSPFFFVFFIIIILEGREEGEELRESTQREGGEKTCTKSAAVPGEEGHYVAAGFENGLLRLKKG